MTEVSKCKDCGNPFERTTPARGPGRTRCETCQVLHRRAYHREWQRKHRGNRGHTRMTEPTAPIKLADPELCRQVREFASREGIRPTEALSYILHRFFA